MLQYDAFEMGIITTDDFTNAEIMEATYPAVANRLYGDWNSEPAIPIVTGFLGKAWRSCAVTTLGRGGSDLTATTIGKALGLREIQVNIYYYRFIIRISNLTMFQVHSLQTIDLHRCGRMLMVF